MVVDEGAWIRTEIWGWRAIEKSCHAVVRGLDIKIGSLGRVRRLGIFPSPTQYTNNTPSSNIFFERTSAAHAIMLRVNLKRFAHGQKYVAQHRGIEVTVRYPVVIHFPNVSAFTCPNTRKP